MKKRYTVKEIKKTRDYSKYPLNIQPTLRISPYISYFFIRFFPFITPNQISFMWEFIMLIGFFIMALGGYWNFLIGILIYHFAFIFDSVDGDIARATKRSTLGGAYLDKFFSWINRSLLLLVLGIGLYNVTENAIYFYLGVWCCLILVFDNLNKLKVYETFLSYDKFGLLKKKYKIEKEEYRTAGKKAQKNILGLIKSYVIDFLRPTSPFTLLFFAILFNITIPYLIFMAVIIPIFFIKNFISIYKKIGNIHS